MTPLSPQHSSALTLFACVSILSCVAPALMGQEDLNGFDPKSVVFHSVYGRSFGDEIAKNVKKMEKWTNVLKENVPDTERRALLDKPGTMKSKLTGALGPVVQSNLKYEYKAGGFKFPSFPFAGGTCVISYGDQKYGGTLSGWFHSKSRLNGPCDLSGTVFASFEAKAQVNWGLMHRQIEVFKIPCWTGYISYLGSFDLGPYVEGKVALAPKVSAGYVRSEKGTTGFAASGGAQMGVSVKVGFQADARIRYEKHFTPKGRNKIIASGELWKLTAQLNGNAQVTGSAGISYSFVIGSKGTSTKKNKLAVNVGKLTCTVGGEASVEWGKHKISAQTTYQAIAKNSYSTSHSWDQIVIAN